MPVPRTTHPARAGDDNADTRVFSGSLHEPNTATVVRESDGQVLTADDPFNESKDHLGGFYIEAADLDAALGWATNVTACIKALIEVRPCFRRQTQAP